MSTSVARGLPLEELARLPSFYLPSVSYGQDRLAYYADQSGRIELYVRDLPSGEPHQLSHGEVPRALHAGFIWNRAGTAIVFAKDTDGDEQHDLYQIDVASGAVSRLTEHPGCQEFPIQFSPDDGWLLFATNRVGQMNLWRMRADGSEEAQLTAYTSPVQSGGWSHDGRFISYTTNESPDLRNADGYIMRADGSEPRRIFRTAEGVFDAIADWSPDDRLLAVVSDGSGLNRTGLLEVETGLVRWLGDGTVEETPLEFSQDGRWLICLRNKDSETRAVLYDVASGEPRELTLDPGIAGGAQFALGDRAIMLVHTSDRRRAALLLYYLADDRLETLLEPAYGSIDPSVFVPAEHIWYPSSDGHQIPALLYRPRDVPAGTRLPALVYVHGGPTGQFFRAFDPFTQYLVSHGYVILAPNVRGSTGYGREFRELNLNDWGGGDLEDVVAGTQYLASLPEVDPERLGIFGVSYGGYMTYLATVKRPELWKAGVASVGMTDLLLLYEHSMEHFKYYLRHLMGDPQANAELYRDRSAITYARNLQAKLLILHGANDPRVPLEQARTYRDALLAAGKTLGEDFEYVEFDDQGHGSTDIEQRVRTFTLMAEFFDRAL